MKYNFYIIAALFLVMLIFSGVILRQEIIRVSAAAQNSKENVSATPTPSKNQTLLVFFGNNIKDPNSCIQVFPIQRQFKQTNNQNQNLQDIMAELLKGPTDKEGEMGYFTNIPQGVKIQKITIKDGNAIIDFNGSLERGVNGLCQIGTIRSQISQTLQQFPDIKNITISINGKTNILEL